MRSRTAVHASVVTLLLLLPACRDWFPSPKVPDVPGSVDAVLPDGGGVPTVDPMVGQQIGEACTLDATGLTSDCRMYLKCIDGLCRTAGDTQPNQACIRSDECDEGLFCSLAGICAPAGLGAVGAGCTSAADCEKGLTCRYLGFSGVCSEAGDKDLGEVCAAGEDCLAGLICGGDGTCQVGNLFPAYGFEPWPGVGPTCQALEDDPGPPRIYFEIPRGDVTEFFRLPFPNDIRMSAGHVDLQGFPTPGPGLIGFDPVERLVGAIEGHQRGFSTVPTVVFRFAASVDFGTVTGSASEEQPATLRFFNIDTASPSYGGGPSYSWFITDGGGKYICPRWVSVSVGLASPLDPATTYAVLVMKGVRTVKDPPYRPDGEAYEVDTDFALMMSSDAPTDPIELAAWTAYAPLRAFLDDSEEIDRVDVLAAAVFTTQPVEDAPAALREAVHASAPPTPADMTLCDGVAVSPCDDGLAGDEHVRGCFDVSPDVWELHMRVPLPVVQKGVRPYLSPGDGGALQLGAGGAPVLQGTEDVCVSLTIPKDLPMPADGWPLLVYGHGTGGTFRSAVGNAGQPLSHISVGGLTVGAAVVGWDGPMHGERRHSDLDPEALFYNFANPQAALGNLYQGATDVFALVRAFRDLVIAAADSPTGQEIRFDAARVMHMGHSQGSNTGPLASPYEPDIRLNIWSGAGAGLIDSLLHKTKPVDAKAGVAAALQEVTAAGPANITGQHPVLMLVQGLFDPVDPLNHARFEIRQPREDVGAQHVLHVYGLGDSYTPPETIETFARVLGVQHVAPVLAPFLGESKEVQPPLTGNFTKQGQPVTGGLVQAQPLGYDGHYIVFRDPATTERFRQFVGTYLLSGVPTIIEVP